MWSRQSCLPRGRSIPSTATPKSVAPRRKTGIRAADSFTLIELISVLAIVATLLTLVIGAFFGWTRASGIDDAANLVAAALNHAREQAITQSGYYKTRITCSNVTPPGHPPHGVFQIQASTNESGDVFISSAPSNALPTDVCFRLPSNPTPQTLDFHPDGRPYNLSDPSVVSNGCVQFTLDSTLGSSGKTLTRIVEANLLSGLVRVHRGDEP